MKDRVIYFECGDSLAICAEKYTKAGETGFLSPISILFDEDTKIAIVKIEEYK